MELKQVFQISAKNLGQLNMGSACCRRCFWIKLHSPLPPPFGIFPGLFSSLDRYCKCISDLTYECHGRAPQWVDRLLGPKCRPVPVPHWSKFRIFDKRTQVWLSGVPDEVWQRPDGSYGIVDSKTARHTTGQDALRPQYEAQLNGYCDIAEALMGSVTWLGLVYFEPITDVSATDLPEIIDDDAMWLKFAPAVVPIERNKKLIPELLRECRALFDSPEPPKRRENCKDCERLDALVATVSGHSEEVKK